jgi:ABC-type phosphate transport system substrate-binding protein
MKRSRLIASALSVAAMVPATAAADIYVIANPALVLSADEAKEAFLGEKQLAGSVKLVPIDNAAAQAEFLSKVYGMDLAKYNTLWAKKGFRDGLNAPPVRASDLEVIANVKSTPGAIGYVSAPAAGVVVIRKY